MKDNITVDQLLERFVLEDNKEQRIKLNQGFSYGNDIKVNDIKIGDFFHHPGNRYIGRMEGVIKKVNPKKIKLDMPYFKTPGDMMTDLEKSKMIGGYITRGKIVHFITESHDCNLNEDTNNEI